MPSAPLLDLIGHLDALLNPSAFDDYGPNGLQVPGSDAISTVVTGVSASVDLFQRAAEHDADLVLVHHGLFWGATGPIDAQLKRRLELLFEHNMALAAYHLPLDAHPEVGNNALLAAALGASEHVAFAGIGRGATFAEPVAAADLFARVREVTRREPLVFDAGPPAVRRLAIVSGGAAGQLPRAIAEGYDAFLTGEPKENVMADAREAGIHFIAAGHYATETFGVRRLGELLAARFGVEHVWVDLPNPV
jgi:dinuclear metal center YbgI/SA1388 family protein